MYSKKTNGLLKVRYANTYERYLFVSWPHRRVYADRVTTDNLRSKKLPIPKEKQKLYGKILGHMLNLGKGKKKAKKIADKAVDAGKKSNA